MLMVWELELTKKSSQFISPTVKSIAACKLGCELGLYYSQSCIVNADLVQFQSQTQYFNTQFKLMHGMRICGFTKEESFLKWFFFTDRKVKFNKRKNVIKTWKKDVR